MPSARLAALVFAGLVGLVSAFQLALALGAPWGAYAMGGAFPGVMPAAMRVAALVQIAGLGAVALVVLSRAGVVLPLLGRLDVAVIVCECGTLCVGQGLLKFCGEFVDSHE